jgi:hypothetical protein
MRAPLRLLPVLALAALLGCPNSGEDRLLTVSATGVVKGFVVFDVNGSRTIDQGDDTLAGVRVRLVTTSARDSIAAAVSAPSGLYRMSTVPAGTYLVVVDTAPFADTVIVAKLDSSQVTIPPGDSVTVNVLISYPHVSVRAARTTVPLGRKVFIEGVALNSPAQFRDTTLHLQDTSAAIRSTRVRPTPVAPGDSVRLRGTTGVRSGQRTLDDVTPIFIAQTFLPQAAQLTTAVAASAQSGARDAQQIRVLGATISDTATVTGDFRLTVSDGSGSLEVLLDLTAVPNLPAGLYVPGNKFDIVGLLVPTGVGPVWRLKPRSSSDLVKQ